MSTRRSKPLSYSGMNFYAIDLYFTLCVKPTAADSHSAELKLNPEGEQGEPLWISNRL